MLHLKNKQLIILNEVVQQDKCNVICILDFNVILTNLISLLHKTNSNLFKSCLSSL